MTRSTPRSLNSTALSRELTAVTQPRPDRRSRRRPRVAATFLITAGDNPDRMRSEACFAALCGVNPIDASSGKTTRHRLNRGGDRHANNALWRIVMVRLSHRDQRTRAYLERRRGQGRSDREIIRCLKRYVARELYRTLTNPDSIPHGPRPTNRTPRRRHHPDHRRRTARHLGHPNLPTRTRPQTRRRPRHPLQHLAPPNHLTGIGARDRRIDMPSPTGEWGGHAVLHRYPSTRLH